jgi:UDP-glucose:glycoprotein glucosyltransferase
MANLGYFQLKANPGVWDLAIREGRSSEVFTMESLLAKNAKAAYVPASNSEICLTTFRGATIFPRFRRRPGQESVDLLDDGGEKQLSEPSQGFLSRATSL